MAIPSSRFFLLSLLTILLASCSLRGKLPGAATASPVPLQTPIPTATATATVTSTASPTATVTPTPTPLMLFRKSIVNVSYCAINGVPQHMDIYMPDQPGPWPLIIFLHGGGWRDGDKAQLSITDNAANIANWLIPLGYVVASVNYRLYPDTRFPGMIEDAKCAVRFMRTNAAKYNIDPNRFVAWGVSAGGHLAALLGTTDPSQGWDVGEYLDQPSTVQAVIDISGPSDLTLGFKTAGLRAAALNAFGINKELRLMGSPVSYASAGDAPFLILNGDRDPLIPIEQGQAMYDTLVQAGVHAKFVTVKNGAHNLTARDVTTPTSPTQDEIRQIILDFLNLTVKLP